MRVVMTAMPESSEAEVTVAASRQEFDAYIRRAARRLSKARPLPGFRPGRAPVEVVEEAFGKDRLLHDAADEAIPRFFVNALMEHNVEAIGSPRLVMRHLSLERGVEFTGTVAVLPTVRIGDVASICVVKRPVIVTDEAVEKELNYLARQRSTYLDVARPAQMGDTVVVDFRVTRGNTLLKGGESKNHPVHLGEGHFVPDFERQLKGIQAGEERQFPVRFPNDYTDVALKGTAAQVWVKAHRVQKRVLPALDDALARSLGKFADLGDLKRQLKANLLAESEQRERERYQGALIAKLVERTTYGPVPELLIEREIDERIKELSQILTLHRQTIETYAAARNKTVEQIRQAMRPTAQKNVRIGLAMREYARQQGIEVTPAEVEAKVNDYLARFRSVRDARRELDPLTLKANAAGILRNQKALRRLEEQVTITESADGV